MEPSGVSAEVTESCTHKDHCQSVVFVSKTNLCPAWARCVVLPVAGAGHLVVVKAQGAVSDSVASGTVKCPDIAFSTPENPIEAWRSGGGGGGGAGAGGGRGGGSGSGRSAPGRGEVFEADSAETAVRREEGGLLP